MTRQLVIDVFFEFICPWCLIGKRQLHHAIQQLKNSHPDVNVVIQWRGVQLLPQIPKEGIPFKAFYLVRLGNSTAVLQRQEQVRQAAKNVGIEIDFSLIPRMPNTEKAHLLFKNASKFASPALCDRLLDAIFTAYFHHSEDISDIASLQKIASYCGFTDEVLEKIFAESESRFISADTGGKGVPYFVFDRSFAMVGAQPTQALYQAMLEALDMQEKCA
jgi:predicted DsbA family dithiol-disulfide isomerase